MVTTLLRGLAFLPLLLSCSAFANWDPETIVPQFTYFGNLTAEEKRLGTEFRNSLVHNMAYWRDHGLKTPPQMDGLYYFAGDNNIRIRDVLRLLNPKIADIEAHIEAQYEAFQRSELVHALRTQYPRLHKFRRNLVSADQLVKEIFNVYAMIRYGFSTSNFYNDFSANKPLSEINRTPSQLFHLPTEDNAFFLKSPLLDFTELLTDWDPQRKRQALGLPNHEYLLNSRVLEATLESFRDPRRSVPRKIVILPRSTQNADSPHLSTLNDHSVGTHEQGHYISNSIQKGEAPHRIMEEVMADYFAAAPVHSPEIGAQFASISEEVADRIGGKDVQTSQEQLRIHRFKELAASGVIRNLSTPSNIDDLNRVNVLDDDYTSGNPARYFLWTLRNSPATTTDEFDSLVLQAWSDFSDLPKTINAAAGKALTLRSMFNALFKIPSFIQKQFRRMNLPKLTPNEQERFHKEALAQAMDEFYKWNPDSTEINDSNRKKFESLYKSKLKTVTQNSRRDDGSHPIVNAKIAAQERIQKVEQDYARERKFLRYFGLSERPPIAADYVLPEYFRSFYRTAQRIAPHLLKDIRKQAETAMNSRSMEITTAEGVKELVFTTNSLAARNALARARVKKYLDHLEALREGFKQTNEQIYSSSGSFLSKSLNQTEIEQALEARNLQVKRYGEVLEGLQEYERTGSLTQLFAPRWKSRLFTKLIPSIARSVIKSCSAVFKKKES